jgi:hypothetical protein
MAIKRKKLTILDKVKIIHKVENNQKMPATEIARKFDLPLSSLIFIMRMKQSTVDEVKCRGEVNKRNCVYLIQNIPYLLE